MLRCSGDFSLKTVFLSLNLWIVLKARVLQLKKKKHKIIPIEKSLKKNNACWSYRSNVIFSTSRNNSPSEYLIAPQSLLTSQQFKFMVVRNMFVISFKMEICTNAATTEPCSVDPMGCSPPDSSASGIFQERILREVDISSFSVQMRYK